VDSTRRRLASNILPSLGSLQIAEIEAPDIVAMVRAVEARGARDVAKRALETTGQIFRYAIAHGYAKRNPATEIRPRDILKASLRLNYARIDAKELPNLLRQIEVYQGTHVTRLAMKLMWGTTKIINRAPPILYADAVDRARQAHATSSHADSTTAQ
jgi:site-specific recombinase XerD